MSVSLDVRNVFAPVEDAYKKESEVNGNPNPYINLRGMVAGGSLFAFSQVQLHKRALWPKGYETVRRQLGTEIRTVAPRLIVDLESLKPKHQPTDVEKEIEPRIEALRKLQGMAAENAGQEDVSLSIDVQTQAVEQSDKEVQTVPEPKIEEVRTEKSKTNYWLLAAAAAVGFAAGFFLARRN